MSVLGPEGVPQAVPAPAPVVVQTYSSPAPGLKASHVAGGGFAGVVGAVAVAVCNRYGWHISDVDAVVVGSAAVSAGAGLGHVISKVGFSGAFKALWRGGSV